MKEFEKWLCEGRVRAVTARSYWKRLWLLSKLADVNAPDKVKTIICSSPVSEARKQLLTNAYDYYCGWKGLTWNKPRFTREDVAIFLPAESELDALIANVRHKMSVFLQFLKETGADSGEAWKLKWTDVDAARKTVSVTPTKNHNARTLPVSENLIARLLILPRKNERVFASQNLDKMRWLYERARNSLAAKLNNPRIRNIAFKSFRHWKATMLYHSTKDILHVQWFLGHRRIENTLVYTHLASFESSSCICEAAMSAEEAKGLVEQGFDYVTTTPEGSVLFRKPK